MGMLKNNIVVIILITFTLACVFLTSCDSVDDLAKSEEQTSTVTLHIDTRAVGSGSTAANEGIKTLRVIAAITSTRTVVGNVFYQEGFTGSIAEVNEIVFSDIPYGNVTFYAIANEASLGLDLQAVSEGSVLQENEWENKIVMAEQYFPLLRRDIGINGLPITGIKTVFINQASQTIEIPITRVVAKIELNFTNNAPFEIPIYSLVLGEFMPDRTYLFSSDDEGEFRFPSGVTYQNYVFLRTSGGSGVTIQQGENKELLVFYVLESQRTDIEPTPYTLGIETVASGVLMNPKPFMQQRFIKRNTRIVVDITIDDRGGNKIEWEVKDWSDVAVDVPSFS